MRLLVTRPECKGRTKDDVSTVTQLSATAIFSEQCNEGVVSFSHKVESSTVSTHQNVTANTRRIKYRNE